ncbi:hypothetical protein ANRL2_03872 [Anaerolineae bacterium]|nr:hypothetical protein ANRL2_03872 [Anaerolineae bacterium]
MRAHVCRTQTSLSFPRRFVWTWYRQVSWLVTGTLVMSSRCLSIGDVHAVCHIQLRGSFRLHGIPFTGTIDANELDPI